MFAGHSPVRPAGFPQVCAFRIGERLSLQPPVAGPLRTCLECPVVPTHALSTPAQRWTTTNRSRSFRDRLGRRRRRRLAKGGASVCASTDGRSRVLRCEANASVIFLLRNAALRDRDGSIRGSPLPPRLPQFAELGPSTCLDPAVTYLYFYFISSSFVRPVLRRPLSLTGRLRQQHPFTRRFAASAVNLFGV